jgi:hypothetical protein
LSKKAKELGRSPEDTASVKDCFSKIQQDIKEPIDTYISSVDENFLEMFLATDTQDRVATYKPEIIKYFEKLNIQLTFHVANQEQIIANE